MSESHVLVMIVEDDVFERMGASYMFADAGYRVLAAENSDQALQLLETNADVRLLFTDVSMPGSMSGADLARQVAQRRPEVGVIMTSGRPRPDALPSSTKFHAKPYEPANVLRHASEMTIPLKHIDPGIVVARLDLADLQTPPETAEFLLGD